MTENCPYREECGAYVLGALTLDEHQALAEHLTGCLACQRDVRELQAAATALPLVATQYDPPRELKGRIMAVVESEADGSGEHTQRRRHSQGARPPLGHLRRGRPARYDD